MHTSVYISALQCPLVRPPPAAVPCVGHIPWENPGAEQLSAPALFFSLSLVTFLHLLPTPPSSTPITPWKSVKSARAPEVTT